MAVTIYHNPACGTSRNVLAMIRAAGIEPTIVDYLKTPPSRDELKAMAEAMGGNVRKLLRHRGTPYGKLGLADTMWSDDALIDFISQHPILLERPIVVTDRGTALCRPSEKVFDLLPEGAIREFTKESGEVVRPARAKASS